MKAQLLIEFPKTKDKVRGSIPYGYRLVEDKDNALEVIPEHIELLAKMINGLIDHTVSSLREAKEIIESELEGVTISHQTIQKYVKQEKVALKSEIEKDRYDNKKKTRNDMRKEWYRWKKRAEAVGIKPLSAKRPTKGQRKEWEESIVAAEEST